LYAQTQSGGARDALAKALYCRTVATIVRRANSLKRLCMSGTLSSDSNDSVHNQAEVASQHASTVGTAGSKSSRSMAVLNTAVRHATDGFIGILDMFGFEDPKVLTHTHTHLTTEQFRQRFIAPPLTNRELYPTKLITNSFAFFDSVTFCHQIGIDPAESVGTLVHQLVCGNDAAFLQHAHLQVEHRILSGGRHPV
jgi:hypothetical protein